MKCPNCGWHVRGGAHLCPNCGAEMRAEGPRTCPQCHVEIKGQVSLCPNCSAVLDGEAPEGAAEGQDQAAAAPPKPEPPAEVPTEDKGGAARTCPNCKSELKGRVGICPVCGQDLSGPPAAARRPRVADDWPFSNSPGGSGRSLASKMKPLSPNWPFDEPEPPAKKRSRKKTKKASASKPAAAEKAKPAEAEPAGADKADAEKRAAAPKPPAAEQAPASEQPAGRGPAEAGRPPSAEQPPEVKPWYVAGPEQGVGARPAPPLHPTPAARPTSSSRPARPARPSSPTRRTLAAGPAPGRAKRTLLPSQALGLLPWFGLLAGLVLVSIAVYGVAVGGIQLPHLGAGQATPTATPTVEATEAPTQTPQPTPTGTPLPPTPTVEPLVHVVQPNESLLSIAEDYGIAVEDLIAANEITQADVLRVGEELLIPGVAAPTPEATSAPTEALTEAPPEAATAGVTPTATPSATPAEGETATLQPTPLATPTVALEFPAPNLLNPADGATFAAEDILLNWSSVGLLADDTWYVVKIWTDDPAQATPATGWTRTTSWRIPVSSRPPADAASHIFHWTVTVMRAVEGQEAVAISPVSETRSFEWQ